MIEELVKKSLAKKDGNDLYLDLFPATENQIDCYKLFWDKDVRGYKNCIDESAIRHILKKHVNTEVEIARGNLPFTLEDFAEFENAIVTPDLTLQGDKPDTIEIAKRINGHIIIILIARKRNRKLAVVTAYKKPRPN